MVEPTLTNTGDEPWVERAVTAFVVLGIAVRLLFYVMRFPLWADESMVAVSFHDATFTDLLKPLAFHQVAPVLFLWSTQGVVNVLGFNEYALRLIPFLCAVVSVPLFRMLAGRLLGGVPLMLAVGVFAVSYYPIRYAAEVKPYAGDLLVSLVITWLAVCWYQASNRRGRGVYLWLLAALMPLAIGVSYPAVFVAGGVWIALAWPVWRSGRWADRLAFACFGAMMLASFLGTFFYVAAAQYAASTEATQGFWAEDFPPITRPLGMAIWFVQAHTGRTFGYPIGAENGGSVITFLIGLVGIAWWWRRGDRFILAALLLPFFLLFIAAVLRKYPYGGSGRVTQHIVPVVCLLAGAGGGWLLQWIRKPRLGTFVQRGMLTRVAAGALTVFGLGLMVFAIVHPYRDGGAMEDRDFSVWLWSQDARGAVVVDGLTDLDLPWLDHAWYSMDGAKYMANLWVYRPHDDRPLDMKLAEVSATRPLHVAILNWPKPSEQAQTDRAEWLADMQRRYTYLGHTDYLRPRRYRNSHTNNMWVTIHRFAPLETRP